MMDRNYPRVVTVSSTLIHRVAELGVFGVRRSLTRRDKGDVVLEDEDQDKTGTGRPSLRRTEARARAEAHRFLTHAMRRSSWKSPRSSPGLLIICAGWRPALGLHSASSARRRCSRSAHCRLP